MPTKKELRQRQAIPLFLLGKTDTEVAEEIGVSRQTIWKWRREEDFDHDIVEAGEELLAQHTVAISELVKKASPQCPSCLRAPTTTSNSK